MPVTCPQSAYISKHECEAASKYSFDNRYKIMEDATLALINLYDYTRGTVSAMSRSVISVYLVVFTGDKLHIYPY